jgi:hypothetical protein
MPFTYMPPTLVLIVGLLHDDNELYIFGNRSFDESTWGAFDTNDDVDSVWGFNPAGNKVSPIFLKHSFILLQLSMDTCWIFKL